MMKQKEIEDKMLKMIIKLDRNYWKANPNEIPSYEIIENFKMKTGLEIVILRPPLVYGPGVKANFLQLANAVRHFISRILGPSLELMGTSIELLKYEGLAEAVDRIDILSQQDNPLTGVSTGFTDIDVMLTFQAPRAGTHFHGRQCRCVIDKQRCLEWLPETLARCLTHSGTRR